MNMRDTNTTDTTIDSLMFNNKLLNLH